MDLGLIGDADPQPAGIEIPQTVADEPLVATLSPDHPLATQTAIALGKLKDQPAGSQPPARQRTPSAPRQAAPPPPSPPGSLFRPPTPARSPPSPPRTRIAIITHAAAATYAPDVQTVKITRPELRARLKLAWRSLRGPTSPAARALTDHARGQLSSQAISQKNPQR